MIETSELTDWGARFGVAPEQIERDHFVSHVLAAVGALELDLHFFGGTALCRTYLEGSRLSEDIDLLSSEARDTLEEIKAKLPKSLRREFPDATWGVDDIEGDGFVAFLGAPTIRAIKIYVGREGPNTAAWNFAPTDVHLRYSDLNDFMAFSCPTLPTFAAMKLSAWYDRHAPRDLFDLAGLAAHRDLRRDEVEGILLRKLPHGFIDAELERVPSGVENAWLTELGAQAEDLPSAQDCLRRAAEVFTGPH